MAELEKVIKGLESLKQDYLLCKCDTNSNVVDEAIAMLKEQEGEWLDVDDEQNAFDCSICGAMVRRKCLYCPVCGAKMKNGSRAIVCV